MILAHANIAGRVIAAAYENRSAGTWTPPPGVVAVDVDRITGKPADTSTPVDRKISEWFLIGTEPGALAWPLSLFRLGPIGY